MTILTKGLDACFIVILQAVTAMLSIRQAGLNVSGITQAALAAALAERDTNCRLDSIARMQPTKVTHAQALAALHAARDEIGTPASG
jgi:post-segregation antitoxin (ccd killing protein)